MTMAIRQISGTDYKWYAASSNSGIVNMVKEVGGHHKVLFQYTTILEKPYTPPKGPVILKTRPIGIIAPDQQGWGSNLCNVLKRVSVNENNRKYNYLRIVVCATNIIRE